MDRKNKTILVSIFLVLVIFASSCGAKDESETETAATPQVVNYTIEASSKTPSENIISVVGVGTAKARPDLISFRVSVDEVAPTTSEALTNANQKINAIYSVLTNNDVKKENAVTSSISIGPRTKYNVDTRSEDLIGQAVSETILVTIDGTPEENEEKLAKVLDELGLISGIKINSINFSVKDQDELYREARKKATFNALSKADDYASGLGITVKEIKSITEGSSDSPYRDGNGIVMFAAAKAYDESASSIIVSGDYEVSVKVTLVATI